MDYCKRSSNHSASCLEWAVTGSKQVRSNLSMTCGLLGRRSSSKFGVGGGKVHEHLRRADETADAACRGGAPVPTDQRSNASDTLPADPTQRSVTRQRNLVTAVTSALGARAVALLAPFLVVPLTLEHLGPELSGSG